MKNEDKYISLMGKRIIEGQIASQKKKIAKLKDGSPEKKQMIEYVAKLENQLKKSK